MMTSTLPGLTPGLYDIMHDERPPYLAKLRRYVLRGLTLVCVAKVSVIFMCDFHESKKSLRRKIQISLYHLKLRLTP